MLNNIVEKRNGEMHYYFCNNDNILWHSYAKFNLIQNRQD
jgi:hypothetical protein